MGCKGKDLVSLVGTTKEVSSPLELLLSTVISNHYVANLNKFRGVVEIDESCFKSSTTKTCKSRPDK